MMRTILLASLFVLLPLAAVDAQPSRGVVYSIIIDCPGAGAIARCPIQAVDGQDAMGDPALAVDPDRPDDMIMASLHGGGPAMGTEPSGPTGKSRSGQVFTTFTSQNHGANWYDNPFTPPAGIGRAFGEHPSITIDPYGHVFVGSLYSVPVSGSGPSGVYDYVIAAQKFSDIRDINANQDGDYRAQFLGSVYAGNAIRQMWFVFNPVTDNMTMVWTEQVTPNSYADDGARISDDIDDVLRVAAREQGDETAAAPVTRPTGVAGVTQRAVEGLSAQQAQNASAQSVIGVVWSTANIKSDYYGQPREHAIGPCETSTNPVISEDWLYIGCKVAADEGTFRWNPDTKPGRIEMFRMHPDGGEPQYLGSSPLSDGKPKLGVRSDGRIALMTADVVEGELRLDGVYGKYSPSRQRIVWDDVHHYADDILALPSTVNLVDANIQDMIYREYSGVVHMILKQVVAPDETAPTGAAGAIVPAIRKAVVAIDEGWGVLFEIDLDLGNPINRTMDPALMQMADSTFNDLSDDFLELPPGPYEYRGQHLGYEYQREFIAVADYGIVLFAEVIEITDLRPMGYPPPPPPPPPPLPAPAPAPVAAAVPASALSASALVAGTVATMKRKSLVKAGRKKQ